MSDAMKARWRSHHRRMRMLKTLLEEVQGRDPLGVSQHNAALIRLEMAVQDEAEHFARRQNAEEQ